MAKLFLSYARADLDIAQRLAEALAAAGHEVWWDRHIHGGSRFSKEIDQALMAAEAILVLWSRQSCESAWVQDEAAEGRDSGRLVPLLVDEAKPPLGFRQFQSIDLSSWTGGADGLETVLSAIAKVSGRAPQPEPTADVAAVKTGPSICVLPFINMSGDPEQEYFSDGISEDITTDLSKISALSVTARNTAFTFKGSAVEVPAIARKLGVAHILEGSVRKSGNRIRINAQLINGATGDHVWAERYDRDLTDIFAIQDEITKEIVAELKLKLLPGEKKAIEQRGTNSAEAYNLYLMARNYWITGNHGDPRREERTERICQRAVELDPDYGRAWALMAMAQATLRFGYARPGDGGLAAAEKALAIDPNIAEAHAVLARIALEGGKIEEANAEIDTALRLDPDSWEVNKEAGRLYQAQRRIDDATRAFEKAVGVMPSDYHGWGMLITFYNAQGNKEGVRHGAKMMVSQAEKVLEEDPSNSAALGIGAGGLAVLGQEERAKEWMERALLLDPDNLNVRYNFACVFASFLNDPDGALRLLELPLAKGRGHMIRLVEADPDFDCLRDDPRFRAMVAEAKARIGIL